MLFDDLRTKVAMNILDFFIPFGTTKLKSVSKEF